MRSCATDHRYQAVQQQTGVSTRCCRKFSLKRSPGDQLRSTRIPFVKFCRRWPRMQQQTYCYLRDVPKICTYAHTIGDEAANPQEVDVRRVPASPPCPGRQTDLQLVDQLCLTQELDGFRICGAPRRWGTHPTSQKNSPGTMKLQLQVTARTRAVGRRITPFMQCPCMLRTPPTLSFPKKAAHDEWLPQRLYFDNSKHGKHVRVVAKRCRTKTGQLPAHCTRRTLHMGPHGCSKRC